MRCSLVFLVALVGQASADISANDKQDSQMPALPKKDTTEESDAKALLAQAPLATPAPEREATPINNGYVGAPTKLPWQKIAGPVVAGVVGAAALSGVIAVSVMKNKQSTVAPRPVARAKEAVVTTLAPTTTAAAPEQFASSGLP